MAALVGLARRLEVNRAVLYSVLTSVWSIVAGFATLLVLATFFSPEMQGFYFTFRSVLALQVFVEFGLGRVIIQFAAHEWSKLSFDARGEISGDSEALSRLVSLERLSLGWFTVGGIVIAVGLSVGGYLFFSQSSYPHIDWVSPWILLCALTGMKLIFLPVWSLLEGCNQVSQVYGFRLIEGMLRSIAICCSIVLGAGLWAPVISVAIALVWGAVFLWRRYLPFLRSFFFSIDGPTITWSEIWPMQWRIALSWLSGYFVFSLFNPVLFHYHGAEVAGQMGMTLQLITTLSALSIAWVSTRAPRFGVLVAREEYASLDRLFFRTASIAVAILLSGGCAILGGIFLLNTFNFSIAQRLLPLFPAGLVLLGQTLMELTAPFSIYLRAHRKEPYVWLSVITGVCVGFSTWFLGSRFGVIGMSSGYLAIVAVFTLPCGVLIWYRCRAKWHGLI